MGQMHYLKELWCRSEKYFTENLTSTELYVLSLIGTVDILASKIIYNLMYFIQKNYTSTNFDSWP